MAETQDVTDGAAAEETGDTPVGAKRGRRPGSINKTNRIAKEAILEAEPHMFLIKVMKGQKFRRAGSEGGRRTVDCYPTLTESISAGETLLRKIAPDMKAQEVSGPDGAPITTQHIDSTIGRDKELARRLALLKNVVEQPQESTEPPTDDRPMNGRATHIMPLDGPGESANGHCSPPVGEAVTIDSDRHITVTRITDDGRSDHGGDWLVQQGDKDVKTLRGITMEGAAQVVQAMDAEGAFDAE